MATQNERLREARIKAGFSTSREAAIFLAVNEGTYNQHENDVRGKGTIPRNAAINYAARFGVSLDWLMTGRGAGPVAPPEPSEGELAEMIESALLELRLGQTGLSLGDLPRIVAPSLHEQLKRYRADRAAQQSAEASAPDKSARSRVPTKPGEQAEPRNS